MYLRVLVYTVNTMRHIPVIFHSFSLRLFSVAVLALCSLSCAQLGQSGEDAASADAVNPEVEKGGSDREGYQRRIERIEYAVKNGDMTREEADELHAGLRRRLASSESNNEQPARTITRGDYAAAAARMKEMVVAGEASQEDVNRRLGEMRRMMKRSDGQQKGKVDATRKEMAGVRKRIGVAIDSGQLTPEQGRARWDAYMESRSPDARRTSPETYDTALAKLLHMVEEGEVTAEQALRRLQGMRARMQKSEGRKDHQDFDQD